MSIPAAALTNLDIAEAKATTGTGGKPAIELTLTEKRQNKIAKPTENPLRKPLAIIPAGKVISAPIIRDKNSGNKIVVRGDFTKDEAAKTVTGIKAN